MKTTRTRVSKTNKAIKALLAVTFPDFAGRKVTIVEACDEWTYTQYADDATDVAHVHLDDMSVHRLASPTYLGPPAYHRAHQDVAVVMRSRSHNDVMIVVPSDVIDAAGVAVAVDGALEGTRTKTARAAVASALSECGLYAGIASAIVERQAKDLREKQEAAAALVEAKSEADIDAALRKGGRVTYRRAIDEGRSARWASVAARAVP